MILQSYMIGNVKIIWRHKWWVSISSPTSFLRGILYHGWVSACVSIDKSRIKYSPDARGMNTGGYRAVKRVDTLRCAIGTKLSVNFRVVWLSLDEVNLHTCRLSVIKTVYI